MFLIWPNQPNLLRSSGVQNRSLGQSPLSELYSPLPKCPSNLFGARGLEEFFSIFFSCWVFHGFESAFGWLNYMQNSTRKKKFKKFSRQQLDEASIAVGSITGVAKIFGRRVPKSDMHPEPTFHICLFLSRFHSSSVGTLYWLQFFSSKKFFLCPNGGFGDAKAMQTFWALL